MKPVKITSLEELKELAVPDAEFFIMLNFGLRSSKRIEYDDEKDSWWVYNDIDDTEMTLTTEELAKETNIIKALEMGALYLYG